MHACTGFKQSSFRTMYLLDQCALKQNEALGMFPDHGRLSSLAFNAASVVGMGWHDGDIGFSIDNDITHPCVPKNDKVVKNCGLNTAKATWVGAAPRGPFVEVKSHGDNTLASSS